MDTDQWQLIGAPGGLEIVAAPARITVLQLSKTNDQVTIDLNLSVSGGQYQLQESADFTQWQPVPAASFQSTGNNNVRVTVNGVTGAARFYRIFLAGSAP